MTAIAVSVGLVKRDLDAQEGRMARMEIGAKLAGLKVRLQVSSASVTLGCTNVFRAVSPTLHYNMA